MEVLTQPPEEAAVVELAFGIWRWSGRGVVFRGWRWLCAFCSSDKVESSAQGSAVRKGGRRRCSGGIRPLVTQVGHRLAACFSCARDSTGAGALGVCTASPLALGGGLLLRRWLLFLLVESEWGQTGVEGPRQHDMRQQGVEGNNWLWQDLLPSSQSLSSCSRARLASS